jgi:hypothetical protein
MPYIIITPIFDAAITPRDPRHYLLFIITVTFIIISAIFRRFSLLLFFACPYPYFSDV